LGSRGDKCPSHSLTQLGRRQDFAIGTPAEGESFDLAEVGDVPFEDKCVGRRCHDALAGVPGPLADIADRLAGETEADVVSLAIRASEHGEGVLQVAVDVKAVGWRKGRAGRGGSSDA